MGFFNLFSKEKRNIGDNEEVVASAEGSATAFSIPGFRDVSPATALSAFFAAMELISNSVAMLPISISLNNEPVKSHPVNLALDNMLMTKFIFIKKLIQDAIIHGEGFAYISRAADGTPIKITYCEHGTCTPHYNQNKQELYYRVPFMRKGRVEPCDVIHIYKNTAEGVLGKSLITFAGEIISLASNTNKAASKYYSSGCAVQGALTLKGTRKNAKEQARAAFAATHSGQNASGIVILDDDMTYQPLSSNANESQMLEARQFNVNEIARFFNINPVLLGDLSHASYNTIEAANIEFVSRTLMPYISIIEHEFTRKLLKPSERESGMTINIDESKLLMTDKNTMQNYLKTLTGAGILSINEARAILGMKPIEGGDDHIIPFTDVNQNKIEDKDKNIEDKPEDEQE